MGQLLSQGLEVSFLGMSLTFAALGLLVLVMILLERGFRRSPVPEQASRTETASAKADVHTEEVAVAVSVAITYLREQERSQVGLGATLGTGHGAYWVRGRALQASHANSIGNARSQDR